MGNQPTLLDPGFIVEQDCTYRLVRYGGHKIDEFVYFITQRGEQLKEGCLRLKNGAFKNVETL